MEGVFGSKMTDSVLLLLGTLFFLVFLLRRVSIGFKGSCVPARLTRALSRWLPRAMAQGEVSAMRRNQGTQKLDAEASVMGPYTELGLRRVWNERKRCQQFCDLQPRQPQAALNFDIVIRIKFHCTFYSVLR